MKIKFNLFLFIVSFLMSCTSPPEAIEIFPCDDNDINQVKARFDVGKVEAEIINLPSKGALPSPFYIEF